MTNVAASTTSADADVARLVGAEVGWKVVERNDANLLLAAFIGCTLLSVGLGVFLFVGGIHGIRDLIAAAITPIVFVVGIVAFIDWRLPLKAHRGVVVSLHADIDFTEGKKPSVFKLQCGKAIFAVNEATFYALKGGEELVIEHSSVMRAPRLILARIA